MNRSPEAIGYRAAFGALITKLRGERRQTEIAEAAGISQSVLSRIERGQLLPDAYQFGRLASALGATPADLDRSTWAILTRAAEVASSVYRRGVTQHELVNLPAVSGLFVFLASATAEVSP